MDKLRGNRWVSLGILTIGFLMILIDTTIVNVSIPTLIKELGASLTDVEWIISGYALSFAALLITFGRLADMYGRRNFFLLGLLVFAVASYFAGHASTAHTLIGMRFLQGIGGAMISPSSLSIISATFKGRERATAFGIWGATAGIAVALGPVLGGYFTTYQTWRDIFYVNIPIAIVGIILGYLIIPESRISGKERLDIAGMLTSALGFLFLVFALIEGQNYGWITPHNPFIVFGHTWNNTHASVIPLLVAVGIGFLLWFAVIQEAKTRKGLEPAVNIALFQSRAFSIGLITISVIALGEFSSLFTLPIYLQSVKGYTPLHSGYATLPLAFGAMFAAPLSAKLVNRLGTKWVITTGICLETVGLLLLSLIRVNSSYTQIWPALLCLGVGIGLAISQNTQATLSEIPPAQAGSASGVLNTVRQLGSALGIAVIGAVLAHQVSVNIAQPVQAISGLSTTAKSQIIANAGENSISSSSTATMSLPLPPSSVTANPQALEIFKAKELLLGSQIKAAVDQTITKSIGQSIRFGSIFLLLGALLSLRMPNIKHEEDEAVIAAGH